MIRMKQRIVFVTIALTLLMSTVILALTQPVLVVKTSLVKKGSSYLALLSSPDLEEIRLTDDMFQISFPRVCEMTEMIGFTHHTAAMKAVDACAKKYRNQSGTMYRSMEAVCIADAAHDYWKKYGTK